MKLIVDENIPAAQAAFGQFGTVLTLPGRSIDRRAVADAEVLILRSVTRVDAALVEGSRLRFVGTTTAGVDHVDRDALEARGIRFAHAPGSNADSVVDYVLAALALRFPGAAALAGRTVGIIGCGEVGGRLLRRLRGLGVACRVFDPFVQGVAESADFARVLQSEVLSLHVPLTRDGAHPTWQMLGARELQQLPEDGLLLNTARGPVIDNAALAALLAARPQLQAVLDVWDPEPELDGALLARAMLGTPHIAGYAADGKLRGAEQVYLALSEFMGHGAKPEHIEGLRLAPAGVLPAHTACWQDAVLGCYDPRGDDARLRAAVVADPARRGAAFDRLRRDYPLRREFSAWLVHEDATALRAQLLAAGFSG